MSAAEDSPETRLTLLRRGAAAVGAPLPEGADVLLLRYLDAVLERNRSVNVTSVRDPVDAVTRHLVDSLSLVAVWHDVAGPRPPRSVLDLGTGGGFPGVPLAVAWPRAAVMVIDGTGKKVRLVADCLSECGIENVEPFQCRGADLPKVRADARAGFDLCVARGVGRADVLLRELGPLVAPRGVVLLMKGPEPPEDEVKAGRLAARRRPRLDVLDPWTTHVPGLMPRTVLAYRRR